MRKVLDQRREKQIPRSFSPLGRLETARNDKGLWAAGWATAGAAVWAGIAMLAPMGMVRVGVIELMFLFAPLVIVPLGMELGRISGGTGGATEQRIEEMAQILQPLGAILVVVAIWLPPGNRAGWAALGWMAVCGLAAIGGAVELGRMILAVLRSTETRTGESPVPTRIAEIVAGVARLDLAVGGAWLVTSRLGLRPLGIQEPIGMLTAVHFHYAGFATAMIASATIRFAEREMEQPWLRRLVVLVILLPFVVAIGFVVSPELEMGAGLLFSASVALLAVSLWMCGARVPDGVGRGLLRGAAGAVFVGMALSGTYAVADYVKSEALTIPRMASTHGILNGLGFCLLGLLGWLVEWRGK